jgi:hypothetical protein
MAIQRLSLRLPALVLAFGLAACSRVTFLHDTLETAEIDGRTVTLSWMRLADGEYDIVAWADDKERLDAKTAREAVETLVARRCAMVGSSEDFTEDKPKPSFASGRHAFRYRCN